MTRCPMCGQPVGLDLPRTTGKQSQNAHLHGHLRQIAEHCGYTMEEVKDVMKRDVPEWPWKEVRMAGKVRMVPKSEADASMSEESAAIEWCHRTAAELDVALREE